MLVGHFILLVNHVDIFMSSFSKIVFFHLSTRCWVIQTFNIGEHLKSCVFIAVFSDTGGRKAIPERKLFVFKQRVNENKNKRRNYT